MPAEGKTSTSTNLAIALAQAGRRVLLVDGDLRRPRVADLLDLEAKVGLTTVLVGKSTLAESIQTHKPTGLSFLAGGPIPPNPTEVLQAAAPKSVGEGKGVAVSGALGGRRHLKKKKKTLTNK